MKVYVVLAVHNRKEHTVHCLHLLQNQSYNQFSIVLVDDGSDDGTSEAVEGSYPFVHVIKGDGSWWWARSMNEGFQYAVHRGADVIITLNNDIKFDTDLIKDLVALHRLYPRAVIGCLNTFKIKREYIFYSGIKKINWWKAKESRYHQPFTPFESDMRGLHRTKCLNGRGTLIPASVFETIGYFDDLHFPQYASDFDFTLRAVKAGIEVMISWDIRVQSVLEVTGRGRSFIQQSWWTFLKSFGNHYSANSLRMWWYYYGIHAQLRMITGFPLQLLRLVYSFYCKRNQMEGLK